MKHFASGNCNRTMSEYQQLFEEELNCEFHPLETPNCKVATRDMVLHYVNKQRQLQAEEDSDNCAEDPFYIVDLSHVVRQVLRWKRNLPNVEMRYAVKCNPNDNILKVLEHMNVGFDCASREEIKAVLDLKHKHLDSETNEFDRKRIIFANPCKQVSHIKYAREKGIQYTTLDNESEIVKLAKYWPEAKCVIRIATDDSNSLCQFSTKFGANLERAKKIIHAAKQHKMDIVGVSFHVGSACQDAESFCKAIASARKVFDLATHDGFKMTLLDIGGGFPGFREGSSSSKLHNAASFEQICDTVRFALDKYFSDVPDVQFIGEPGRYIARGTHTLAINVFAKRDCRKETEAASEAVACSVPPTAQKQCDDTFLYYVNDGIYQSFNNIYFDHYVPKVNVLEPRCEDNKYPSTLFGPTCDSIDVLCKREPLPELDVGDWLYFTNHGSYTVSCATIGFNGFTTSKYYYVWRD